MNLSTAIPERVKTTQGRIDRRLSKAPEMTLVVDWDGRGAAVFTPKVVKASSTSIIVTTPSNWRVQKNLIEQVSLNRLILFLPTRKLSNVIETISQLIELASRHNGCRVCVISDYSVHFGNSQLVSLELKIEELLEATSIKTWTIIRPGCLIDVLEQGTWKWKILLSIVPLISNRFRSSFLQADELAAAIESLTKPGRSVRTRILTILGVNQPLKAVLNKIRTRSPRFSVLTSIAWILRLFLVSYLLSAIYGLASRKLPRWQQWRFDTLEPTSTRDLMALYNRFNLPYVALAGYNNGVTHFGWRYADRTVVKTVSTGKRIRIRNNTLTVDTGVILKNVVSSLNQQNKELFVVPNYSYISMGTVFFVPVHGSGSAVSTLGSTIKKALLYDPLEERFLVVKHGTARFAETIYNPNSNLLLIRLTLSVRDRSRHFAHHSVLTSPTSEEIWNEFWDESATHVEVRKSRADTDKVDLFKYYDTVRPNRHLVEVPRDSLGRLWDRLEENPLTSVLFHAFVRKLGFHVEIFLDQKEFNTFWIAHSQLPLSKIQLRFARRDGFAHSPSRDRDCVSADLFMRKSRRAEFLNFQQKALPNARFNPGKHSA